MNTRREFLQKISLSAAVVPLLGTLPKVMYSQTSESSRIPIHIFSKHLQFLDVKAASEKAAELGFAGIDLTVRPKGHIEPHEVEEKLAEALEAIRSGGSSCSIMTTAVESATNIQDQKVLQIASENGVKYYRCNWYDFPKEGSMEIALDVYGDQIEDLGNLNRQLGIIGCYQNHAGMKVGASVWEIKQMLAGVDKDFFGIQFDIRHATVEAGLSWKNSLRLMLENIKTIVLKDFIWIKQKGTWKAKNVPIGEGMVDFTTYFHLLKKHQIKVPAVLHLEYDLGGAEHGKNKISIPQEEVFRAMKRDKAKLEQLWEEA